MATVKILGIHGLGDHRTSNWEQTWAEAVRRVYPGDATTLEFEFVTYDDIFEKTEISPWASARALYLLAKSGLGSIFSRDKGALSKVSDRLRWTAGYVVAWVESESFQKQTRERILDAVREHKPDVVLAHSLGSLVSYNAFSHADATGEDVAAILAKVRYVTLGSQIGNAFVVRNLTPGRIEPLAVEFWHHLYNKHDDVFTAPIKLWDMPNFAQVDTPFDDDGWGDHTAETYLSHAAAIENLWRSVSEDSRTGAKAMSMTRAIRKRVAKAPARKKRRALLVGINDYPNEQDRLSGCVNDVFTMSSVLQETGFEPESIRAVLDDRATAQGILSRLEWLLDDPQPGDERVFYFSGHGASIPEYGEDNEPDQKLESLVPWDFNWSPETAITDNQIYSLYSQLPFGCRFVMIFDCCHAGGMHRQGGARARGITPPDDIRHRELKWDKATDMWVERSFKRINESFTRSKEVATAFFGQAGSTVRLGRASMLRGMSQAEHARRKAAQEVTGPYLPLILQACGEGQLSYEYRHGASSYGAFTYCLAKLLRKHKTISFEDLVGKVREDLRDLQYDQTPQILGPTDIMKSNVPWMD